ncbi:MAG: hypothetical protein IKN81_05365 [Oscillospiraceae bacterium]|nr:hypothetical protein [Oscillospiraceae bacterium]
MPTMPTGTMILTILGAIHATAQLMHLIEWLDTPHTKKAPHPDRPTKASRV